MNSIPTFIAQSFNIDIQIVDKIIDKLSDEEKDIIMLKFTSKNVSYETIFKYYGEVVPRVRELINNEIVKSGLTVTEYQKNSDDFISLNQYSTMINRIRDGYYKTLAETLNPLEYMVVAMRFLNINGKHFSTKEISEIFEMPEEKITNILNKVFKSYKQKIKKW